MNSFLKNRPCKVVKTKRQIAYLIALKLAMEINPVFTPQEVAELKDIYNSMIAKYENALKNLEQK